MTNEVVQNSDRKLIEAQIFEKMLSTFWVNNWARYNRTLHKE